ncbi:hypothetical protein ACVI1K_007487 [Bradyrhizobium sp. USDA 4508]
MVVTLPAFSALVLPDASDDKVIVSMPVTVMGSVTTVFEF